MNNSQLRKILYVENGIGYGGAIICLRHLVRNLDRKRFEPMVVTGRTGAQYREIANEARWKHIADRHFDAAGWKSKLDTAAWPKKIPGLVFLLNQLVARCDDLLNFLPFYLSFLWTAWRFKPDLIHVNNEPLCNREALMVARLLKIPSVCHVRGNLQYSHLTAWTFGLPTHFTPVSLWVAQNMKKQFQVPDEKMTVIYDGLELDGLDPAISGDSFRREYHLQKTDFAVGLVGLLIAWKGQEIFLDAARMLKAKIPHLKMMVVGGTPDDCADYEKMLRQRVSDEGLEDLVVFTGHVTDMPVVYNGLDIVVSASTSPEPLGTVVIESMTLARPLIGPNHGGAAEMMQHEVTGLLFRPGDAQDLADKIQEFYESEKKRISYGQAARKHALETFAVSRHVTEVQQVYDNLLHSTE
ncbi:MAG: glycosyltransferase family 4 protein [Chromatiales bacterium]|jgi:glycosyltransferase involved in cell wall biosynthesis